MAENIPAPPVVPKSAAVHQISDGKIPYDFTAPMHDLAPSLNIAGTPSTSGLPPEVGMDSQQTGDPTRQS